MKKLRISFVVVLFALLTASIFGQGSWSDNFNSGTLGTGWAQTGQYGLKVESSQLTVNVNKSNMWASFSVSFAAIDVRTKPILNVKVKTAEPFQFSCYLVSAAGNVMITMPVMTSNNFNNISFDFTGKDVSNNVLNAVTSILFCVNGSALSWSGTYYMEDVMLGNAATKLADVSGVGDQVFFQGKTGCKVFLRGIANAASLSLTGADALIQNITFDPLTADGASFCTWMKFDCKAGVNSFVTATLTANGSAGYTNNSTNFRLEVEGNKVPTIAAITNTDACKSIEKIIDLSGISDGNAAAEQTLTITATSSNTTVTDNPTITYAAGSKYATLKFTPKAAGTSTITVTLNDGQVSNNITTTTFTATVLNEWNNKPTIDFISNKEALNNAGQQTINLSGISDGDGTAQTLTFTAVSSDATIIPNPTVQYTAGSIGTLKYTPVAGKTGFVTITLTITDNGGNVNNNGNQSTVMTFQIEAYSPPLTGYVIPFNGTTPNAYDSAVPGLRDYWHVEGMGVTQTPTYVTDGTDKVLQLACNGKSTWSGTWYYTPDMDLTDYPLLSMWVKCDQTILFHIYFWDDSLRNNEDHHLRYTIPANTWTKVNFDFSDPTGMNNGDGQKVNAKRIKRVLFNYHPSFGWPFTNWSGQVRFRDVRIGDQSGIVPTYYCTVDTIGQQTYFMDTNPKTIKLTGISRGKDNVATVAVTGTGVLKTLSVSSVVNGEATITFTPSQAGSDVLTVTVTGAAISGKVPVSRVMTIPVAIVNKTTATPSVPTFTLTSTHQTYRGVGALAPGPTYLDLYTTGGFGATATRIGVFDNQVEMENDNADPLTLDRSKLNYNAFDWDYYRNLKANGVETFILTIWSPPSWMKENLSTHYQQAAAPSWGSTTNRVMTAYYDEYAEDVVALALMFKEEAGITLTAIGMQNEPNFCEPYASAILDPTHFAQMVALAGPRLAALGLTTKLYVAEQVGCLMSSGPGGYTNQMYLDALNSNATAKPYSDIFAVHGYANDGVNPGVPPGSSDWANTYAAINANGKARELWMTETEPTFNNWNDAFVNAGNILTAFESGNVALWTEWAWDGHCISKGKPTQKFWAQSMFQYIKPGALRLTSTSGHTDIIMSTWKNDVAHGDNYVIVVMNKGNTPLTLNVNNATLPADFSVFRCSEQVPRFMDAKYTKGDKLLLAARSIVTLVSGLKATPTIDQVTSKLIMNDGANKIISLSGITDGNSTNQNPVTISYTSSNPGVLSNVTLNYTSPATTGTFNYRPATLGITQITMTVTAAGVSTTMKFNIEVKDYAVPNINPVVVSKDYDLGSTVSLSLAGINDGDDGTQTVTITAAVTSSSPAGVLGTPTVVYTSQQATGTVNISALKVGTAEVTITVTDNGPAGKNTTTTKATVVVVQHFKPTIAAIKDTTVKTKASVKIPIVITNGGDADNIDSVVAKSSNSNASGLVFVSTLNDYITFLTKTDGTATITVTVYDNGPAGKNTATTTFKVTMSATGGGGIDIAEVKTEAAIYPNPAADILHLETGSSTCNVWKIANANGLLMKEGKVTSDIMDIDVMDLTSGSYLLILENGTASRTVLQFMKK